MAQAVSSSVSAEEFARQASERLEQERPAIDRLLSGAIPTDRFLQAAVEEVTLRARQLVGCSLESVVRAVKEGAQFALLPGRTGFWYLWPSFSSDTRTKEAQCMLGYRGIVALVYRSGLVESITGRVVHEKDAFEIVYGTQPRLVHVPSREKDPGGPIGAYIVMRYVSGGTAFHYLTTEEIERRRARSKAPAGKSPWATDWEAMALKTVVRDAMRWLPVGVEVRRRVGPAVEVPAALSWDALAPDSAEAEDAA